MPAEVVVKLRPDASVDGVRIIGKCYPQTIYDNIPVKDKKRFSIEGATRRFGADNNF